MTKKNTTKPTDETLLNESETTTAVATASSADSALVDPASCGIDYGADEGVGSEDFSSDDIQIPVIKIVQSNSPYAKKSDPDHIEGASEGMIVNNLTRELYDGDKGLLVIPCYYERKHVEWRDKDDGGGYVAAHDIESNVLGQTTRDERGRDKLPDGNEIIDTAYHYVIVLNPEDMTNYRCCVLPMSRTSMKVSKRWNGNIMGFSVKVGNKRIKPACYGQVWTLKTKAESNDQFSWMNWVVDGEAELLTNPAIYEAAKQFRESILAGQTRVAESNPDDDPSFDFGGNSVDPSGDISAADAPPAPGSSPFGTPTAEAAPETPDAELVGAGAPPAGASAETPKF